MSKTTNSCISLPTLTPKRETNKMHLLLNPPPQCCSPPQTPSPKLPSPSPSPSPSDTFSWNSLLRSHHRRDDPYGALVSFRSMLISGAHPDSYTLPLALSASRLSDLFPLSQQLHALSLKLRLLSNPHVLNSLILSYSHFHGPNSASTLILRESSLSSPPMNPISLTLLLTLFLKSNQPGPALHLFDEMLDKVELDPVLLLTAAKACGRLGSLCDARRLDEMVEKRGLLDGLDDDGCVSVGNSFMKMYLDCERIEDARVVFERMRVRDLISWTTMIRGYVESGGFNEGLKLLRMMCREGVSLRPDSFAVSAVLPACARMSARKNGKEVHAKIIRLHLGMNNKAVENALMDMYIKSGSIEDAFKIFERMASKDNITWTVMILGCSLHGQGEAGFKLLKKMEEKSGVSPDKATFAAALHAANTACLVEDGRHVFNRIAKPEMEHFALMAGLLSRGRYFIEARSFVEEHQLAYSSKVHRAVLDGCRIHRNVKLAKRVNEQLIELEPLTADNYVLLSNFYAATEKWGMVNEVKDTIRDMGLKTRKAYSWIEIRNKVHVFGTGDVSHPRSEGIYWEIGRLMNKMKEEGFVATEDYSLHDVDEERECIPCGHSEMLAIGLGLISGSLEGAVLRVTKNLRVCRNCHDAAKLISRIVGREIILKDPDRFHHFKNGACSCRDMW